MARIIQKYYDHYLPMDPDDFDYKELRYIELEEDGVIYGYDPKEPNQCSVAEIEEGFENIIIADTIRVESTLCPVVRWGIPLEIEDCTKGIKTLVLGKNLREYNELTIKGLDSLEKLVIPESIEKFPPIGCVNLKEITLSEKYQIDLENFAWSHPKLEKITLLKKNGEVEIIQSDAIAIKRKHIQDIKDAEELLRKEEEIKKKKQEKKEEICCNIRQAYFIVVCAIPYIWALIKFFKTINFNLGFIDIIGQLIVLGLLFIGLFAACVIAVFISYWLSDLPERLSYKYFLALFTPIIGIPLSWLLLTIVFNVLTILSSCEYYGVLDPRAF